MKYVWVVVLSLMSSDLLAWGGDAGKINRLWSNGWTGKANHFCFELVRDNGSTQVYGVRESATEENKNRIFSMLLAAQLSAKDVELSYHPDVPSGSTGPDCENQNAILSSRGVHTVSIIP